MKKTPLLLLIIALLIIVTPSVNAGGWNSTHDAFELNISTTFQVTNNVLMFFRIDNTNVWSRIPANFTGLEILAGNTTSKQFQIFQAGVGQPFNSIFGNGTWIGLPINYTANNRTNLTLFIATAGSATYNNVTWFDGGIGSSNGTSANNICDNYNDGVILNSTKYMWGNSSLMGNGADKNCMMGKREPDTGYY